MSFWKKYGGMKNVKTTIFDAFPDNLRNDVEIVINAISPHLFFNEKALEYNARAQKYYFTLLNNEQISVPYRLWVEGCCDCPELSAVQQTILHCIYSRSTDGYIREKHIKAILYGDMSYWVFPFVLMLCDEYVLEILAAIYDCLRGRDNSDIQVFCQMNISYFVYGHARMISYWNYFYRDRCCKYDDYIGKKLYEECFGYTRRFERYYDKSLLSSYKSGFPADCMPPWSR